jgi:hypothetical protein
VIMQMMIEYERWILPSHYHFDLKDDELYFDSSLSYYGDGDVVGDDDDDDIVSYDHFHLHCCSDDWVKYYSYYYYSF